MEPPPNPGEVFELARVVAHCLVRILRRAVSLDANTVSHYCLTAMKTVSLRTLVREPLKVKRMTRTGLPVQVTDNGQPLWVIQAAPTQDDTPRRRSEIEAELAEVLREPPSNLPLSTIVLASRR